LLGTYELKGPEWDPISKEAKDLITKMLISQESRITANEVLQHPWLQSNVLPSNIKINSEGISNFYKSNKFKRIALSAVAFYSEMDHEELGKIFNKLDKDGDGHLSFQELTEGLNTILGSKAADLLKIYENNMSVNSTINYHGKHA